MKHIPVLVLPISELGDGVTIDHEPGEDHLESCYNCGSPYFIIKVEEVDDEQEEELLGKIDNAFICAVCGTDNGGIFVDNDKGTAVRC